MSFLKNSKSCFLGLRWNKLDRDIHNNNFFNVFKFSLLKFVRPVANSAFEINNPYSLKLLTRLRLGLSHLRYHKFRHNFQDCINAICVCGPKKHDELITKTLLYGVGKFDLSCNKSIISSRIEFTVSTKRFSNLLV